MVAAGAGDLAGAASWAGRALEQAMLDGDLSLTIRATMLLDLLPPGMPGVPSRVPGFEALLEAARAADDHANEFLLYPRLAWNGLRAGDPLAAADADPSRPGDGRSAGRLVWQRRRYRDPDRPRGQPPR